MNIDSLWLGLKESPSLSQRLASSLLKDFPCLYTVTTPEQLLAKIDKIIRDDDLFSQTKEEEDPSNLSLLFTTAAPSSSRRKLHSARRNQSNDRSRFQRPLWALNEDDVTVSPFNSITVKFPQDKLASFSRRFPNLGTGTSIPTTVGGSSLAATYTQEPILEADETMSSLWQSNLLQEDWLQDDHLTDTFDNKDAVLRDETPSTVAPFENFRLKRPPSLNRPSTQVFCHMLAALRERNNHHHQPSTASAPTAVIPSTSSNRFSTYDTPMVRPRSLGHGATFSSSILCAPHHRLSGVRSSSGSPTHYADRSGYADDRERMVFVSWIPKRTRSYTAHEKRRLELELKAKLKDELHIQGVSKVLLFPPKGAHCKIIFQSRGCAAEFMKRYGGDHSSLQTERWKRDICGAFDIEMTDRFQPTVVKIEWAQK